MRFLNFGSLNIDKVYSVEQFVAEGETVSCLSLHTFAGGKGLNQAIALAKAGAETYQAGGVGDDGELLVKTLHEAGVSTKWLEKRNVDSGHAVIQVNSEGKNCILIAPGANYGNSIEYISCVLTNFSAGDVLLLQNEIDQNHEIMQQAKAKGLNIALNPSPLNEAIFALDLSLVDILLLNEHEALALAEKKQLLKQKLNPQTDYTELLALLCEHLPQCLIVLTLGSVGAICQKFGQEAVFQPAFKVKAVDTTAAGDTFTGYFLVSYLSTSDLKHALKMASLASAIAVTRAGAAPSIPLNEEVLSKAKELNV